MSAGSYIGMGDKWRKAVYEAPAFDLYYSTIQ